MTKPNTSGFIFENTRGKDTLCCLIKLGRQELFFSA